MEEGFKKGDIVRVKNGGYSGAVGEVTDPLNIYSPNVYFKDPIDHEWNPYSGLTAPIHQKEFHRDDLELVMAAADQIRKQQNSHAMTLQEAFRVDMEARKPKYYGISAEWLKEGKCPQCGELGRYHLSTPICSRHGPY